YVFLLLCQLDKLCQFLAEFCHVHFHKCSILSILNYMVSSIKGNMQCHSASFQVLQSFSRLHDFLQSCEVCRGQMLILPCNTVSFQPAYGLQYCPSGLLLAFQMEGGVKQGGYFSLFFRVRKLVEQFCRIYCPLFMLGKDKLCHLMIQGGSKVLRPDVSCYSIKHFRIG